MPATHGEFSLGFNFRPRAWLNFRPEARLDVSDADVFGPVSSNEREHHQPSGGVDCLVKFQAAGSEELWKAGVSIVDV